MHQLGHTRSARHSNHLLQTPDTFVRAPLPGMQNGAAIVHVNSAAGARFTQYSIELESGGLLNPAIAQRFVYVLEGELRIGETVLCAGAYAYLPPGSGVSLSSLRPMRAVVIEKPYDELSGVPSPGFFTGCESSVPAEPLFGDRSIEIRALLPAETAFDFAVNTMTFQPGATLPMVEMHIMEHGLLMLAGGGIYRLDDHWYPVAAGDFIWMAPHCPQWFGALGKTRAKYLIYKDWNR